MSVLETCYSFLGKVLLVSFVNMFQIHTFIIVKHVCLCQNRDSFFLSTSHSPIPNHFLHSFLLQSFFKMNKLTAFFFAGKEVIGTVL